MYKCNNPPDQDNPPDCRTCCSLYMKAQCNGKPYMLNAGGGWIYNEVYPHIKVESKPRTREEIEALSNNIDMVGTLLLGAAIRANQKRKTERQEN